MVHSITVVVLCGVVVAAQPKTERTGFPPGGTLRMDHAIGEVTIEGWDQPEIEITTVKPPQVRIDTGRKGDEVVVSTHTKRQGTAGVEYRIHLPRNARLTIEHGGRGQVNILDIAGEMQIRSTQGVILLNLPEGRQYSIDAKSTIGGIVSDFNGEVKFLPPVGHELIAEGPAGAQRLHLRDRYGDILILKKQVPETK